MEKTGEVRGNNDSLKFLAMQVLGVGIACRDCGADFSERVAVSFLAGKRVSCHQCGWAGNWRDKTILQNSNLTDAKFLALFFKFSIPDSLTEISERIGVKYCTAQAWRDKLAPYRE